MIVTRFWQVILHSKFVLKLNPMYVYFHLRFASCPAYKTMEGQILETYYRITETLSEILI